MRPQAQSTLEWTVIAFLVMLGILVGGPYVLNSVKAHFKLFDDSIQDSASDRFIQTNIDIEPQDCKCELEGGICGDQGCQPLERAKKRVCIPQGCKLGFQCVPDVSCCDVAQRGICWRDGMVLPGPYANPPPSGYHTPCQLGDRIFVFTCGTGETFVACQLDDQGPEVDLDRNCYPQCLWPPDTDQDVNPALDLDGNIITNRCPNNGTNLQNDTDVTFLPNAAACSTTNPADKCEAWCSPLYIPTPGGCQIDCSNPRNVGVPPCLLSCATNGYNDNIPVGLTVVDIRFGGNPNPPDCLQLTCPRINDVAIGFCFRGGGSKGINQTNNRTQCYSGAPNPTPCLPQGSGPNQGQNFVTYIEGNSCFVGSWEGRLYCVPCPCASGCKFPAFPSGFAPGSNVNIYSGQLGMTAICNTCADGNNSCDPGETHINCPADCP